ncbi:MAG: isoprenylcysteine carboxyl methyltransferase [Deltaproteobacteria bacterium]|nr:isoprenylcysteine carboxyl methyltransferase [Deltaproteobacteria bacterium]
MSLLWIFAFLIFERLFELLLSSRNAQALAARNAREFHPESFRPMAALHSLFLLALLWESYPWRITLDPFSLPVLGLLALLQGCRYWCIASLGENWNTRIILVPGGAVKRSGPYRLLRHPNYLVVTLEFLLLPLLMHSPYTLAVFFPANLLVLRQRIRLEEQALREFTDYGERFPLKGMP